MQNYRMHAKIRAIDHDLPPISLKKVKGYIRSKNVEIIIQPNGHKAVIINNYIYDGQEFPIKVIMTKKLSRIITIYPLKKTKAG